MNNETVKDDWAEATRYDLIEEIKRMRKLMWLILMKGDVAVTDKEFEKFPKDWELTKTPMENGEGYVFSARRKPEQSRADRIWYE